MIKLAVEATSACGEQYTGIAKYTVNLIKGLLGNEDIVQEFDLKLMYRLSRYKIRHQRYLPFPDCARWYQGSIWPPVKRYDIFHSTDIRLVNWKKVKKITTIHDLAIFRKEHQFESFASTDFRRRMEAVYMHSIQAADACIADSQNTKKDIVELLNCPEEKISVIPIGIDTGVYYPQKNDERSRKILEKYKIYYGYLFFVGAITVRKNLLNLIKAYKVSNISSDLKLVLAGNIRYGGDKVAAEIEKSGLGDRVKMIGYVPEDDLPALYSNARAFLFPTYYEGFGLPILEAMACGTPVLIGNRGAAPETAGGLALQVDPFDIESIAFGIDKVVTIPESNIQKAIEYASGFSWNKCAVATIDLYKKVLD